MAGICVGIVAFGGYLLWNNGGGEFVSEERLREDLIPRDTPLVEVREETDTQPDPSSQSESVAETGTTSIESKNDFEDVSQYVFDPEKNRECGEMVDESVIQDLLDVLVANKIEYSIESYEENIRSKNEIVYGFGSAGPCGVEATIQGQARDLGDSWYGLFLNQLTALGWNNEYKNEVLVEDKLMRLFSVVSDGALSHGTSFMHVPTETEPFLQFFFLRESTLVSGHDDLEGFYCPCKLNYYLFLSERFYIEEMKDHMRRVI